MTSHDLRQPLASLKLALDDVEASAPTLGEKVRGSLDYLNSVLSETLEETRTDATSHDGPSPDSEAVPLQVIFDNVARMFASEAAAKGLDLRVRASSDTVRTNPVTLIRIISNLVSNAIKYTPSGRILIGARRGGRTVTIEVWDTGIGMDAAETEKATGHYWRAAEADHYADGEGLGLASAFGLAGALGLHFAIKSRVGRGSVFRISGLELVE